MFSVAIVNFNTADLLIDCLRSLAIIKAEEIIVVDNASTDDSVARVRSEFPDVTVIVAHTNNGYGAACNLAINHCGNPYLLLLNSDTYVTDPHLLDRLRAYIDTHPRAAIVGPRIHNPDGTLQQSCFRFASPFRYLLGVTGIRALLVRLPILRGRRLSTWDHDSPRTIDWVLGAALAFRMDAVRDIGGFDERFFMYFEEVDLSRTALERGWETHFTPSATITHIGGASTRKTPRAMLIEYELSAFRYYHKHYAGRQFAVMLIVLRLVAVVQVTIDALMMKAGRRQGYTPWADVWLRADRRTTSYQPRHPRAGRGETRAPAARET